MKDTIFVPAFGNRPRNLVGREEILREFEIGLESLPGSRERARLLLGQRGSGKTVLLLEMADLARKKGIIVASPTIASKGMLQRILEKLEEEGAPYFPKSKTKVAGGSIGALGFSAGIQFQDQKRPTRSFAAQLSARCRELNQAGKSVLILVDEVQANHAELRQLVIAYQELVGEGRDITMVLAGLPVAISSTMNDHVLTFLNRASKIQLPPLKIGDIESYYEQVFREVGVHMEEEQIREAAQITEGSPYLMQLLGHYIVIRADENGEFRQEDFTKAEQYAKRDFQNDICETIIHSLSGKDIDLLQAMSMDDEDSEILTLTQRLGVTSSYVQTYKRRLIQAGVIEQHRRGRVRFAVPYLREYLRNGG